MPGQAATHYKTRCTAAVLTTGYLGR